MYVYCENHTKLLVTKIILIHEANFKFLSQLQLKQSVFLKHINL